ncbi:MAG: outer membrane protein transport protein [Planctomycetaceae bacterium]|nr:outer membrane protein transport protein [Planctomycetaceae bacterium]
MPTRKLSVLIAITWLVAMSPRANAQMGHVLEAIGPVNQSMGGAGTALPLDAMGALQWNPASITGLPHSEVGFGAMLFAPEIELRSTVPANTFGPGFPDQTMSGNTGSESDVNPIPSFALVCQRCDSPWTFGLGGFAIGGFGVDFPGSRTNPVLTPQLPDGGMGFGPIYSEFQLMQFCPTVARTLGRGWSVGFAPTINWASLAVSPFSAAAANPDGSYSPGSSADSVWGMGFQTGVYYESPNRHWSFGASYKSPQWFEEFALNSADHLGNPRQLSMKLDYPSIYSIGLGYRGLKRWQFAWDVRYVDYENTDGFQPAGFDTTGAVTGFGWESIWATALGAEYAINSRLRWRAGYTFNETPINNANMFFNSPAPALVQHHLSTGFTYEMGQGWMLSAAYKHGFQNSVTSPWQAPGLGEVPGTEVTGTLATYGLSFGISKCF